MDTTAESLPAVTRSLWVKTGLWLSLVLLALGAALAWAMLTYTTRTFETARQQYALALGTRLATLSQQGTLTEHGEFLQRVVDQRGQEDGVLGMGLVNAQGALVSQHYRGSTPPGSPEQTWQPGLEQALRDVFPVTVPLLRLRALAGRTVYHVAVPILGLRPGLRDSAPPSMVAAPRPKGQSALPTSVAPLAEQPASAHLLFAPEQLAFQPQPPWRLGVVFLLGLWLSGLLASWWCVYYTLAPVAAMTRVARRMASGDWSQRIVLASRDELRVLASVMNRLVALLAQREAERAQPLGELKTLHSLSAALHATPGQASSLTPFVEVIVQQGGYDHVHLFRVDTERQALLSASAAGPVTAFTALQDEPIPLREDGDVHAQVALQRKSRLVHDGQPAFDASIYVRASGVSCRSLLLVPVQVLGRTLGLLTVVQIAPHRRLTESDERLMTSLAQFLAPSLAYAQAAQDLAQLQQTLEQQRQVVRQVQASAAASNATASRFLANISHEIRTPMNGVMGMANVLLGTSLTVKQRRFVDTIRRSGESLLLLINDILDFSKLEAKKLSLETIDFDLRQTVEEVVELLAESAQQKGLELVCDIQATIPTALQGDPLRLRQILTNLIGNAIKFTCRGEVSVRVTMVAEEAHHSTLRCEVRDTGIGMSADVQAGIFDAFAQADGSTTRQYGGTGLGLAITKQLVEMMQGTLQVHSQPGQGSTFWFTARFDLQPTQRHLSRAMPLGLRDLRVLIVDDNATACAALAQQLQALGIKSSEASSGAQAMTMAAASQQRSRPYDLVFLDVQLPDMSGVELAVALRAEALLPHVPLIMLTLIGQGEYDAPLSGIVEYLTKPIRRAQLYTRLMSVMSASGTIPVPRDLLLLHAPQQAMTFQGLVLVAEDNPVNQEVAYEIFTALGCQMDIAANGEEAVAMAHRTAYEVIFMDCQMPVMDGFAATQAIRAAETLLQEPRHVPIVALTAHAAEQDHQRCLAAGMDAYLSKPFTVDELATVLRRWLTPQAPGLAVSQNPAAPRQPETAVPPAAAQPRAVPIDTAVWGTLRALPRGARSLERVLRTYLRATPAIVTALQEAIGRGEAAALHQAAHSLKSSSAHVGALPLAALCQELEDMGRTQTLSSAHTFLGPLAMEYAAVCAALEQALAQQAT